MMTNNGDRAWWQQEKNDVHQSMVAAYRHLRDNDHRGESYRLFESLYTNRDLNNTGLSGHHSAVAGIRQNKYSRVPFNVIKIVVDTVSARIAKMRPRATFLTEEGNYNARKRAQRLQRWVDAQFYSADVYSKGPRVFVDACIFGIGAMKTYHVGEEVRVERVYPGELLVDEHEAFHGEPRQLFQTKYISREVLSGMIPGHEDAIRDARSISDSSEHDIGHDPLVDQVEVVEAWHLPSSEDSGDGRRAIVIDGATLEDESYENHDFPFSFVRWMPEIRGFYGIGLAEDLMGIHLDVNTTISRIEKALELTASPQVWVESGSQVSKKDITNVIGSVNTYSGQKPIFMTPPSVAPEVYRYLDAQIARAFQIGRLSDTGQGSRIPSGLETGAAVRNFHDLESESFSLPARQYEDFYLNIARKIVRTGKQISLVNPKYSVVLESDKNTIERVPWKDIQLDDRKDAYLMRVLPASSLSASPSGRMADIQDLLNMQLISPEEGRLLLDFPDLEEQNSVARSAAENIDRILEKILDEGVYEAPEPHMDLALAITKSTAAVNKAVRMGVPEVNVTKIRLFSRQASMLIKRAQQEEAAAMAMAAPSPGAPMPAGPDGQLPSAAAV